MFAQHGLAVQVASISTSEDMNESEKTGQRGAFAAEHMAGARSTYVIDWPARHPIEDTWQALTWRDRGLRKPEVCSLLRTSVRLQLGFFSRVLD